MKIKPHIFREYDIRGIYGKDLDEEVFEAIGRAFTTFLRGKRKHNCIAIGRDGRHTSRGLSDAVIDGLTACGFNVLDIGEVPSPLLYYALYTQKVDGGLMITASHNPKEYNGTKLCVGTAALFGPQIRELGKRTIAGAGKVVDRTTTITRKNLVPAYTKRILRDVKLKRKLKVVVDAGNGPSGPIAPQLYEQMGCEVIPLFCDVDGDFPNHHPDPTDAKNLKDLIRAVKKHKADLGIAYDGDGDRIGAVDHEGNIIAGDQLLLLFARSVLKDKPGATIISEVKSSRTLYDGITKAGGNAVMFRTGHSFIKAEMKKLKAELAGEMSGHIFFKHRWYGFDDGVYSGARLLEIVASGRKTLKQLLADVPKMFATPEIKFTTSEAKKFGIIKEATAYFKSLGLNVNDIDGARIEWEDGWGLLRASNTSPTLVMRCEATSKKRLNQIKKLIETKVNELNK